MNEPLEPGTNSVFGTMIGALTGQRVDTARMKQATKASARHLLWEGPDAFDADERRDFAPTQH